MKNIYKKWVKITFNTRSFPIFLFFIVLITYGSLITSMGIYWDDWPFAWILHTSGPISFIENFSMFRPFLGPIFVITTSILGESPIAWQIFGILIRYLSAIALWWSLRKIWPNNLRQISWITLFFLVFPGFQEQWVSFTHTNQALIPLCFQILSIGFMAWTLQSQKIKGILFFFSLLFTIMGLFPTEYFFGVELIRPLIIWFILSDQIPNVRKRFTLSLIRYSPFALILGLNALWLNYFYKSGEYDYVQAQSVFHETGGLILALFSFLEDSVNSIVVAGFESWFGPLRIFQISTESLTAKVTIALTFFMMIIISFYLTRLDFHEITDDPSSSKRIDRAAIQMLVLGIVGLLFGRIPSWAAGFPLRIEFPWDRLILPMMLGSSIAFIGLIEYFIKHRIRKIFLFSIFVSLAIAQQFMVSNTFKRDWENVQKFFWQMKWRMPDIQPGTSLITYSLPFSYVTDNSLSAAINWLYEDPSSDLISEKIMPYMLVYSKSRLGGSLLPSIESNIPIKFQYRTFTYYSNTSDSIVFYFPFDGCLRVLDPIYANKNLYPEMDYMLTDVINLSNPELILTTNKPIGQSRTGKIFKSEPEHNWCFYYENAELARQKGDWQGVRNLFEETITLGLSTEHSVELIPFIEAFGRNGELEQALNFTYEILYKNPELSVGLCELWERLEVDSQKPELIREFRNQLSNEMICNDF